MAHVCICFERKNMHVRYHEHTIFSWMSMKLWGKLLYCIEKNKEGIKKYVKG